MRSSLDSRLLTLQSTQILKIVDGISNAFKNSKFTLRVFIGFSKAFDMLDHSISLNRLNQYDVTNKYYDWFKCYLNNREQFVSFGEAKTYLEIIKCGVPLGSILRFLVLQIFVSDLQHSTDMLHLIMFANETSFFPHIVA